MSGTHRDLLVGSKSRCFACKKHRWGLGTIETCNSCAKALFCMHKATGEGWNPYSLFILVLSTLYVCSKQQMRAGTHIDLSFWCKSRCFASTKRHVMSENHRDLLFRSISRCLHPKTTHAGWDPWRLVFLMLITLFCIQKPHMKAGTHGD